MARVHVVTGAASGIGATLVDRVVRAGHRAIGVDLHDAHIEADLATEPGRQWMVDEVARLSRGVVDAVIANAGVLGGPASIQLNYFGTVATLRDLRPMLARSSAPRAVATVSAALLHAVDDRLLSACLAGDEERAGVAGRTVDDVTSYATAKRGVARWIRKNAPTVDWAGAGIALNAVAPGVVRTPMTAPILDDTSGAELLEAAFPMPLGGVASPEAIADLLAFLASAELQAVTGQVLFADGGGECIDRGNDPWAATQST